MSETDQLLTAVLAFLDADQAWGSGHVRTDAAKRALRRTVAMTVHEGNVIDLDHAMPVGRVA